MIGDLISSAFSFLGGERRNQAQAEQAQAANAFSAQQFATRYQTTTKDMAAAGLNPMLAYSQGGGNAPSGQQAQMTDTVTPAVQTFNQSRMASAQAANIAADTENKAAQGDLYRAQAEAQRSSAGSLNQSVEQSKATVNKIDQEIKNLKNTNDQTTAVIRNLGEQYQNLVKQGYNMIEIGNQLRATVKNLEAQNDLIGTQQFLTAMQGKLAAFDVEAADALGNVGRSAGQVKPVIDVLRGIFRK